MSGIFDTFSGHIEAEVLTCNPDAIPAPDMLVISMTRGERRIADELHKAFGGFKRVVIDVDGEQHEFSADSLIGLLEGYEGARDTSRHAELFGTPERAAGTLGYYCFNTASCAECGIGCKGKCFEDYDALLEWLKGASDGE